MAYDDYLLGHQSYRDYFNNRDLATQLQPAVTKVERRVAEQTRQLAGQLDELRTEFTAELSHVAQEIGGVSRHLSGVADRVQDFNLDFRIFADGLPAKLEKLLWPLWEPRAAAAMELQGRATRSLRHGWYAEALGDLLECDRLNGQHYPLQRAIGEIYLVHLSEPSKALGHFKRAANYARAEGPREQAEAEVLLGHAHGALGNYPAALAHLQAALRLAPRLAEAHYGAALMAAQAGHPSEAIRSLESAILLDARFFDRADGQPELFGIASQVDRLRQRLPPALRENIDDATAALQPLVDRLARMDVTEARESAAALVHQMETQRDTGSFKDLHEAWLLSQGLKSRLLTAAGSQLRKLIAELGAQANECKEKEVEEKRRQVAEHPGGVAGFGLGGVALFFAFMLGQGGGFSAPSVICTAGAILALTWGLIGSATLTKLKEELEPLELKMRAQEQLRVRLDAARKNEATLAGELALDNAESPLHILPAV